MDFTLVLERIMDRGLEAGLEKLNWLIKDRVQCAMSALALDYAEAIGAETEIIDGVELASMDGTTWALRQPVSMAAAFDDFCRYLGVETPAFVARAVEGE